MSCSRCRGLMVIETLFNPREGSIHTWLSVARCLNCGNLEDSIIRNGRRHSNRVRPDTGRGRERRGIWFRTAMPDRT